MYGFREEMLIRRAVRSKTMPDFPRIGKRDERALPPFRFRSRSGLQTASKNALGRARLQILGKLPNRIPVLIPRDPNHVVVRGAFHPQAKLRFVCRLVEPLPVPEGDRVPLMASCLF